MRKPLELTRDFTNSKGTRYTKGGGAIGAKFKDRWILIGKENGNWYAVLHHTATGEEVKIQLVQFEGVPPNGITSYRAAMEIYNQVFLDKKFPYLTRHGCISEGSRSVH